MQPDVRNPLLALPEVQAFAALPIEARLALRAALQAVSKDCRARAEKAWRTHKPPMAAYWKANAVNARHLSLAIPKDKPTDRTSMQIVAHANNLGYLLRVKPSEHPYYFGPSCAQVHNPTTFPTVAEAWIHAVDQFNIKE